MGLDTQLTELVLSAYKAAREPSLWPQVMDDLARQFNGAGSVIEAHNLKADAVTVLAGADFTSAEHRRRYETYFAHICPRYRLARHLSPDVVTHDDLIGDEHFYDRDEYCNDFLKPQGLRYYVAGNAIYEPTRHVIISVQRPPTAGRIDADGIARFSNVLPHLGAAFALSSELDSARLVNQNLEDTFASLDCGLALLDRNGTIVYLNRSAETMLARDAPIAACDGRLSPASTVLRKQIDERLGHAVAMAAGEMRRGNNTIHARDSSGATIRLRFVPLPAGDVSHAVAQAACVAVIVDRFPQAISELVERLIGHFGLTPTEAALAAAFAEGTSQAELAEQRAVSIHTVRTHFARIRDKLDARTLADLVRIVLRA